MAHRSMALSRPRRWLLIAGFWSLSTAPCRVAFAEMRLGFSGRYVESARVSDDLASGGQVLRGFSGMILLAVRPNSSRPLPTPQHRTPAHSSTDWFAPWSSSGVSFPFAGSAGTGSVATRTTLGQGGAPLSEPAPPAEAEPPEPRPAAPAAQASDPGADADLSAGPGGAARTVSPSEPVELTAGSAFARALVEAVTREVMQGTARFDALASRARSAAWLPGLRLRFGHGVDSSLRLSPTTTEPDRWIAAGARDFSYEAQVAWDLDRLLYSGQELGLERYRERLQKVASEQAEVALRTLFRRQEVLLELVAEPLDPAQRQLKELQVLQATARLDVLSGGWFSRRLAALAAH